MRTANPKSSKFEHLAVIRQSIGNHLVYDAIDA